ncbi:MAG: hypothetical protein WCI22_05895 [Actinomycetota bacterium]
MRLTSSTLRASVLVTSLSLVALTACSSDSAKSPTTTAAATTTAAPSGATTTVADAPATTNAAPVPASTVAGGGVVISVKVGTDDFDTSKGTRVVSVPKGASVTLEFTDPNADQQYHLHGYDLEAEAKKGETAKISFTADQTGQFDVESHVSNKTLLVIVVA